MTLKPSYDQLKGEKATYLQSLSVKQLRDKLKGKAAAKGWYAIYNKEKLIEMILKVEE